MSSPVKDRRDLRDPAILGEMLLEMRTLLPEVLLSEVYDRYHLTFRTSPHYPGDHTSVKEKVVAYRSKMQQQAIEGDIYALRTLLDHQWDVPDEVDSALVTRARSVGSADAEMTEV